MILSMLIGSGVLEVVDCAAQRDTRSGPRLQCHWCHRHQQNCKDLACEMRIGVKNVFSLTRGSFDIPDQHHLPGSAGWIYVPFSHSEKVSSDEYKGFMRTDILLNANVQLRFHAASLVNFALVASQPRLRCFGFLWLIGTWYCSAKRLTRRSEDQSGTDTASVICCATC